MQGILIFAHNNETIDYLKLAYLSATLAKKHLKKPVTLITDSTTLNLNADLNFLQSLNKVFDQIIEVPLDLTSNSRILYDGIDSKKIIFNNINRCNAYNLSPYDETLLIDCDLLIQSDCLNEFWNTEYDYLIGNAINDLFNRSSYLDRYVSDTGPKMFWATTIMFKKTSVAKSFFECAKYIRDNYNELALLYDYVPNTYRNDIAFSISKHILDGFQENNDNVLPNILSVLDKDTLIDVDNGILKFLINSNGYKGFSIKGHDIHIMNKESILRMFDKVINL